MCQEQSGKAFSYTPVWPCSVPRFARLLAVGGISGALLIWNLPLHQQFQFEETSQQADCNAHSKWVRENLETLSMSRSKNWTQIFGSAVHLGTSGGSLQKRHMVWPGCVKAARGAGIAEHCGPMGLALIKAKCKPSALQPFQEQIARGLTVEEGEEIRLG